MTRALRITIAAAAAACALSASAGALTFDVSWDPSVNQAPPGFKEAVTAAIDFFQLAYDDPVTVYVNVGWGEVGGLPISPWNVAESITQIVPNLVSYGAVKAALVSDAANPSDASVRVDLPASNPMVQVATAEAKTLGIMPKTAVTPDGFIGFNSTLPYAFDPTDRAVPGAYDLVGAAYHELSEVLGRASILEFNQTSILDLYRYSAPGALATAAAYNQYFSIDGGRSAINYFNGPYGGDIGDWAGRTVDAFNAFLGTGVKLPFSNGDLVEIETLGYTLKPLFQFQHVATLWFPIGNIIEAQVIVQIRIAQHELPSTLAGRLSSVFDGDGSQLWRSKSVTRSE